jgi:transformation/transcription domain-associated protein
MVATRHILSTEFRPAFVSLIDCLTSEHVLIGTGVNSQETLRPLAYSMLGDLIHHIRKELSPEQLRRIIYLYSCCLHNPSFSSAIHNMSAKLLANLVDVFLDKFPKPDAASTLLALLETCVDKLGAVWAIHQQIVAANKDVHDAKSGVKTDSNNQKPQEKATSPTKDADAMDVDTPEILAKDMTLVDIERSKPIQAAAFALENKGEAVKGKTRLHIFSAPAD